MYMCVCMYVCIYIHIYIYIYTRDICPGHSLPWCCSGHFCLSSFYLFVLFRNVFGGFVRLIDSVLFQTAGSKETNKFGTKEMHTKETCPVCALGVVGFPVL